MEAAAAAEGALRGVRSLLPFARARGRVPPPDPLAEDVVLFCAGDSPLKEGNGTAFRHGACHLTLVSEAEPQPPQVLNFDPS